MKGQPFRVYISATLLACSAGAQVLAGVTGGLTVWQGLCLLVTFTAAGVGTVLGDLESSKKPGGRKRPFLTTCGCTAGHLETPGAPQCCREWLSRIRRP